MSAIQPQKNFDVIEAISLERTNGERVRSIKITRDSKNWMWSSREPLKNRPIILLIISKSFRAGNVNIIRQKQKSIPPLLKYCWEKPLTQHFAWWVFCITQTRDLHRLLRLVAQRYNSWHDNKVRDRQKKKKKEQFPSEPAHLMNPFVTDGKVCQHTAPLEFSPPLQHYSNKQKKMSLTSRFFPLKLHSSLFPAGVPHVSWSRERNPE